MKAPELKERLEESEKLIQEMTVTWEEKLRKTEAIAQVTHTHTQIHSVHQFVEINSKNVLILVILQQNFINLFVDSYTETSRLNRHVIKL